MVGHVVHCLLLNTDTVDDNMAASGSSQILVWRPSPRTSLSRRCMNSELVELFDKEGEEGGEVADVDEDAEDIEREDEGDGDTLEGGEEDDGRMKEL